MYEQALKLLVPVQGTNESKESRGTNSQEYLVLTQALNSYDQDVLESHVSETD